MMPAMMPMPMAFRIPQSKKCLISSIQTTIMMSVPSIEPKMPGRMKPMIAPITTPRTPIHTESVNLAFCLPTNHPPTIQRTGAKITAATTICTSNDT